MSRTVFALGIHGAIERKILARRCCACTPKHFMTEFDRQLAEQGATITDGFCPIAEARYDAEIEATYKKREETS